MSSAASDPTSRKTSGSSRSNGHSPVGSPNSSQTHRKNTPSTSNTMFGVGMSNGSPGGLTLNTGWQLWGGPTTPTSQRNPSISSSVGMNDSMPSQEDTGYRGAPAETWGARSVSGNNWERTPAGNPVVSPQKNGFPQEPRSSNLSYNKQRGRHEQATGGTVAGFGGSRIDESRGKPPYPTHPSQLDASRYHPSASPTNTVPFGSSSLAFVGQQSNALAGIPSAFDSGKGSSAVDSDLAMGMRGMAVEDDHTAALRQHGIQGPGQNTLQMSPSGVPHIKAPQQQPANVYNSYGPSDYGAYYAAPPSGIMEYQYQYDNYRRVASDPNAAGASVTGPAPSPGTVYPGMSPHPDARQPSLYFDYAGTPRAPPAQFYYSTPAMLYPSHSPMPTPQLSPATPIVHEKKNMQNFMYNSMRSSPSPHLPHAYASSMDYAAQMSLMVPSTPIYGAMGVNPQAMHLYQQNLRSGRVGATESSMMALRSPLLDEFRVNKTRKWELRDIFGYVVEFSGDQHGSRFIQQKLESASAEERQIVFDEIVPDNALQLIQDVFGNYVVQKLFEYGTQVQKTVLAKTMEGHVLTLSLQMYGCRVVQKAIEFVLPEQQSLFVAELEIHVLKCVKDANGNHVIQKLLERVSPDRLAFINTFMGHVYELSTHPYGCRVLQRCFEHLPEEQTRPLLDELHKYTLNLMQDQFGNYVIQFVLEHGQLQDRALIVQKLRGQLLQMARHKFASNVCEKALVTSDSEIRRLLVQEMIDARQDGVSPVIMMMKDQYANYVLQRALMVVDGPQRDALIGKIKPQLANMRRYSSAYSKHLVSIEKLIEKASVQSRAENDPSGVDANVAAPELIEGSQ